MAKKPIKLVCQNPSCGKSFIAGHYGRKQVVGKGKDHVIVISCLTCKGVGEKKGEECWRCKGTTKVPQSCTEWYKGYQIQTRKVPRGIPPDLFSKIEKAAKPEPLERVCMIAARESGLRKGELLGLTWGDIVGADGKIQRAFNLRGQWDDILGFKPTKTRVGRRAYFLPRAVDEVSKLERGKPAERVFPFYESGIYSWFVALQASLGIKNPETGSPYRWHDLRHSLGKELVHGKGDKGLTQAARMLGHKNLNTTRGYSEQSDDEFMDEVEGVRNGKH